MSQTDPIADMLTRIRNAIMVHKDTVLMPSSKLKVKIAEVLKTEGYIVDYLVEKAEPVDTLSITLKYDEIGVPVISGIKRISKPGLRNYTSADDAPRVLGGLGTAILTTSKGVLCDRDARAQKVGGEVLAYVW